MDQYPIHCCERGFEFFCGQVVLLLFVCCCVGSGLCYDWSPIEIIPTGCVYLNMCDTEYSEQRLLRDNFSCSSTKKYFASATYSVKWQVFSLYLSLSLPLSLSLSLSLLRRCGPTRNMISSFLKFRVHTQRWITVGRTPLREWSARRRGLYLTTHNSQNRQTSLQTAGLETTVSEGDRPQPHALYHADTGPCRVTSYYMGALYIYIYLFIYIYIYVCVCVCVCVRINFTLDA